MLIHSLPTSCSSNCPENIREYNSFFFTIAIGRIHFLRLGWIPESLFSEHLAEENILYMRTLASVSMGFSAYILLGLIVVTGGFFMWICRNKSFSSWEHYSLIIHLFSLFLALDGFFACIRMVHWRCYFIGLRHYWRIYRENIYRGKKTTTLFRRRIYRN